MHVWLCLQLAEKVLGVYKLITERRKASAKLFNVFIQHHLVLLKSAGYTCLGTLLNAVK